MRSGFRGVKTSLRRGKSSVASTAEILDAALRLFGARGFAEPSMDDIAAEADYTRRSLDRFFPSKEELGVAIRRRVVLLGVQPQPSRGIPCRRRN